VLWVLVLANQCCMTVRSKYINAAFYTITKRRVGETISVQLYVVA